MSQKNALSLVVKMATKYGVESGSFFNTLKATAFKQKDGTAPSNEQMMALMVVADQYGLNPFCREIYAFPDKSNGIVPVVGVDGWCRIINEHPMFDGMTFTASEEEAKLDGDHKRCPSAITCVMYRKDRSHPIEATEYLDEVYRPAFKGKYGLVLGPWQSHTKRMLRHKAMIQAARLAFGFGGIFDADEAERVVEANVVSTEPDTGRPALSLASELSESEKAEMQPHLERLAAKAAVTHAWEAALQYARERYAGNRQAFAVEFLNSKADALMDAQLSAQATAETPEPDAEVEHEAEHDPEADFDAVFKPIE